MSDTTGKTTRPQSMNPPLPAQPIRVCCCGECGPLEPEQPWTEGELAKAMHAERLEREGCRSNYADERWDESKADRERWYASARVALSRPLPKPDELGRVVVCEGRMMDLDVTDDTGQVAVIIDLLDRPDLTALDGHRVRVVVERVEP